MRLAASLGKAEILQTVSNRLSTILHIPMCRAVNSCRNRVEIHTQPLEPVDIVSRREAEPSPRELDDGPR